MNFATNSKQEYVFENKQKSLYSLNIQENNKILNENQH